MHCRWAAWHRHRLYLPVALTLALFVGAGASADSGEDRDLPPTLRVLKLKQQESNLPYRDSAGEFRMLADFARRRGQEIAWVEADTPEALYTRLRRGDADLVAAELPPGVDVAPGLVRSQSMGEFRYEAYGRKPLEVRDPRGLAGLRVALNEASPLKPYFDRLRAEIGLVPVLLPSGTPRETLLAGVASGHFDAAIIAARGNERALVAHLPIKRLFDFSAPLPVVWTFNAEARPLRDALDRYMQRSHAAVLAPQPAYGDLPRIRNRGTLRAITRIDAPNYFVRNGRPAGFEYEMVELFARAQGLKVEYLVADSDQQMLTWLKSGAGDLITTRVRSADVAADPGLVQARSYFHSASVLVGRAGSELHSLEALAGKRVAVFGNTVEHRALTELVARGIAVQPVVIGPGTPPAALAERIENWSVDVAIVDAHLIADLRSLHPLLVAGMSVPISYNYAWTLRSQNAELKRAADGFVRAQFGTDTYQVLANRYFDEPRFAYINGLARLSPYDHLVRRYAEAYNFDWRLIVAQMYFESQFNPGARSSGGALGLMQLTRDTARAMGVGNPFDPDAGIRGGVRYLDELRAHFEDSLPPRERTWFAIAAYNAGLTRVDLARQRAKAAGLDPTRWFGNVETMMGREFNQRAVGPYRQAIDYVRAIRSLYNTYNRQQESLTAGVEARALSPRG
jgi:membrane-bound lytic murein transglycosylase F